MYSFILLDCLQLFYLLYEVKCFYFIYNIHATASLKLATIIGTPKMRSSYWFTIKLLIFPCESNIELFSIALHIVIALQTLQQQKLLLLIPLLTFLCFALVHWFRASFLYYFPLNLLYCSNYCNRNSCCYFFLLKPLERNNKNLMLSPLRAIKSDKYCYCYTRKSIQEKKQRTRRIF